MTPDNVTGNEFNPETNNNISDALAAGMANAQNMNNYINQNAAGQYNGNAQQGYADQYNGSVQQGYADQYNGNVQQGYADQYNGNVQQGYANQYNGGVQQGYADQYNGSVQQGYADQYNGNVQQGYADQYNSGMQGFNQLNNNYTDFSNIPNPPSGKGPKKNGKKIAIILSIVAVVAALAVAAIIFIPKLLAPKKEDIQKAFQKSAENLADANPVLEDLGLNVMIKKFVSGGGNVEIEQKGLNLPYENVLADFDSKNKAVSAFINDGSVEIYYKDKKLYYKQNPDMTGLYVIDSNVNEDTYEESYISDLYEFNGIRVNDIKSFSQVGSLDKEAIKEIVKKLIDDIEYKYDGTKKITLGSKSVKAKKYDMVLPKEKIRSTVKDIIKLYSSYDSDGDIAGGNYAEYLGQTLDSVIANDIVIEVYEYKGAIVALHTEYDINIFGETLNADLEIKCCGDNNIFSAVDASLLFTAEINGRKQSYEFYVGYDAYKDGSKDVTDVSVRAIENGSTNNETTLSYSYDTADDKVEFSVSDDSGRSMSLSGKVTEISKGSSLETRYDNAAGVPGVNKFELTVGLSTDYAVEDVPSGETIVDFFTPSESEFKSILSKKMINELDRGGRFIDIEEDNEP